MLFVRTLAVGIVATLYCDVAPAEDVTVEKAAIRDFNLHKVEADLIKRTNAQRKAHGLPPLKMCRSLMQSAREHAKWMASNQNLTHTNKAVGENIAMGQHDSQEAVNDWMNSSGHRANILSSDYRRIGVAWARDDNGSPLLVPTVPQRIAEVRKA